MSKSRVIISIVLLFVTMVAIITASLAWYLAQGALYVLTDTLLLSAAESSSLSLEFSGTPTEDNRYFGEKGIEYAGFDAPYVVQYDDVGLSISDNSDDVDLSMVLNRLVIKLAGLDASGNERIDTYTLAEIPENATENLLDYFTVRVIIREATLVDGTNNDSLTGAVFRPELGRLVNTVSTTETYAGRTYPIYETLNLRYYSRLVFSLQIIFQSEEIYQELLATMGEVDESYATPVSDPEYMYSQMFFNLLVQAKAPFVITFDANGGHWAGNETTKTTLVRGWEYISLPTPPTYALYRFDGWVYDDMETAFQSSDIVDNGIEEDLTLYASYTHYPEVVFHKQDGTEYSSTYVAFGETASAPSYTVSGYKVVGWSEDSTTTWSQTNKFFNFSTAINRDYDLYPVLRQTHMVTIDLKIATGKTVTIEHYEDGVKKATINGASQETYTITVYDGETFGSYFASTDSSSYIVQTDCAGLYKFYGWVESPDTINTIKRLIDNNVTKFREDYTFTGDVTVYAQVYLSN